MTFSIKSTSTCIYLILLIIRLLDCPECEPPSHPIVPAKIHLSFPLSQPSRLPINIRPRIRPRRLLDPNLDPTPLQHLPIDLDPRPHHVPRHHGPDPLGRPRDHDVPFLQRHHLADVAQQARELEEHELGAVALAGCGFVVDVHKQRDGVGVRDLGRGDGGGDGQEGVEALGDGPGEALGFCFVLRVARGHVQRQQVGGDVL